MFTPIRSSFVALGASALFAAGAQAAPVTLTFEPFANTSSAPELGPPPSVFTENGFNFFYDDAFRGVVDAGFFFIGPTAPCVSSCTQSGSSAFYQFNSGALSVARADGGIFALLSLNAAQAFQHFGDTSGLELHVLGNLLGGGTVETTISTTPSAADFFSTFSLPETFDSLLSVQFFGGLRTDNGASNFALDNLVLMREAIATPPPPPPRTGVPEPMSATLFAIGAVGLGWSRRRKIIAMK